MTSVPVNDENRAVCPGKRHSESDINSDFLNLDQPTGRPSILRQSQAENLSKSVAKGVKVCFQTPRRDPVTKRIVSPKKSLKMTSLDEGTNALESAPSATTEMTLPEPVYGPKSDLSSFPDEEIPIQSKGGYMLDFDNLAAINPFQGSMKMLLSPSPGEPVEGHGPAEQNKPEASEASPQEEPAAVLDETLPFTPSVENSLANTSTDMPSADSSVITMTIQNVSSMSLDQEQASINSTALDDPLVATTGSPPVKEMPALPEMSAPDSAPAPPAKLVSIEEGQASSSPSSFEDVPLPTRGSYNFDFDNMDSVNPFQSGGSQIPNSPELGRKLPCNPPAVVEAPESQIKGMEACDMVEVSQPDTVEVSQPVQDVPDLQEMKPNTAVSPTPSPSKPPAELMSVPPKEGPVKLEFNLDDGGEVKRKPPKRFGKRPASVKATKSVAKEKDAASKSSPLNPVADPVPDDIVPKGAYSIDFDKFDDPNFNPFGSSANMSCSPRPNVKSSPMAVKSSPQDKAPTPKKECVLTEQEIEQDAPSMCDGRSTDVILSQQPLAHTNNLESTTEPDQPVLNPPELGQLEQNPQNGPSEPSEDFVPGTSMFASGDFDGQIDYLEQFGSSTFKESALRKQSLYLKFDPLLKESPKKAGGASGLGNLPGTAAFANRLETQRTATKETVGEQRMVEFDLLDVPAPLAAGPLVQNRPMLGVEAFPQPVSEDAIFQLLKYSQQDMDAAIARVEATGKEQVVQLEAKCAALSQDKCELRKIISEYETTIAQILAEEQEKKEAAQAALNTALQEKEQISKDMNVLETSFSELFKRLDKYKGVIEGYKKNEELLKKCAQDYLVRIKKEEQRYQTLKVHAEEKLNLANAEIADVRSKLKAEASALQAQLRREQLKAQSLEKSLDQKVKETEDLSKLCDELIVKFESG